VVEVVEQAEYIRVPPVVSGAGVTLGIEFSSDVLDELRELHQQNWDEIEVKYLGAKMDPDYDLLDQAERRDRAVLFTMRNIDGELIGNSLFFIGPSLHVQGERVANEDTFFITKEYRDKKLALSFLSYIRTALKSMEIDRVTMTDKSPVGGKPLDRLFNAAGFIPVAKTYITKL
jgi:hypothetical protein